MKFFSQLVLLFLLPPEGTSVLAGSTSLPPDFEMGLVSARSVPELPDAKLGGWESQEEGGSCFWWVWGIWGVLEWRGKKERERRAGRPGTPTDHERIRDFTWYNWGYFDIFLRTIS